MGSTRGKEHHRRLVKRIGRLFLASDILWNSSATIKGQAIKGAQAYRSQVQSMMPEAALMLNLAFRATTSRVAARATRDGFNVHSS